MNKKRNKYNIIDFAILITVIFIYVLFKQFNIENNNFLGISIIILNTYMVIKSRKNKVMSLLMLMLWYFNYSFVISKYIGIQSGLLNGLYIQLNHQDTLTIGILLQLLYLSIINVIIGSCLENDKNKILNEKITFKNRKILLLIMEIMLLLIFIYHIVARITVNTTLFEYSLLLFIIAFYFSKNDKKNKILLEILMVMFAAYSLKNGDRIAVLQFFLADFIINYIEKISLKTIIISMILGIAFFTVAGLYGDFLDYGYDFKGITQKYVIDEMKFRRFALDTSVSAYFSGLSIIDTINNFDIKERIVNGIRYFFEYTFIGSKSNYIDPSILVQKYQVNYGGAFLATYMYFWFGNIGIIGIGIYCGILFKNIKNTSTTSTYRRLLSIYVTVTLPRWYMYVPTLLFRGLIIFSILYLIIYLIFIKDNLNIENN